MWVLVLRVSFSVVLHRRGRLGGLEGKVWSVLAWNYTVEVDWEALKGRFGVLAWNYTVEVEWEALKGRFGVECLLGI